MLLSPLFERFLKDGPLCVMARAALEYALPPQSLDSLFLRTAKRQYTRELLFSSVVELMALVVCRMHRSVHAAYQARKQRLGVSITALYDKLDQMEPDVSSALVAFSAHRLLPVIESLHAQLPEELPGYPLRIVNGNHLAATEHRLGVLRTSRAAPLPGQALVVLCPTTMQAVDVVLCEDGHAQERSLTTSVLERVQAGELWMADRNFSTSPLLFGIAQRRAFFLIRQHAQSPSWEPLSALRRIRRIASGVVLEQAVQIVDAHGNKLPLRRITLELAEPTRDGDQQIHLLTNLPPEHVGAQKLALMYATRWTVEGMFQELGLAFGAEIKTLGYPRASLFAFCVGLLCYNVLSVLKAALRAQYGRQEEREVSSYYVAAQISEVHRGMMIALPAEQWTGFQQLGPESMGQSLLQMAAHVRLEPLRRHRRGPKKPRPKRAYLPASEAKAHVSTARLLAAAKAQRAP